MFYLVFELYDSRNDAFSFIALDGLRRCEDSSVYVIYGSGLHRQLLDVDKTN